LVQYIQGTLTDLAGARAQYVALGGDIFKDGQTDNTIIQVTNGQVQASNQQGLAGNESGAGGAVASGTIGVDEPHDD
ncbi:MAG TPA: hypothetical protein VGO93_19570, partial [Candidatus Xenobia bacterium]